MSVKVRRVGAVRIFVRDLERARGFYGDILGLPDRVDGEDFSAFRLDGVDIVIEIATADQDALVGRFSGVSFAVPSIDDAISELRTAGVQVIGPPERQFWGGILAHIEDPDRNELTLVEYPAEEGG